MLLVLLLVLQNVAEYAAMNVAVIMIQREKEECAGNWIKTHKRLKYEWFLY